MIFNRNMKHFDNINSGPVIKRKLRFLTPKLIVQCILVASYVIDNRSNHISAHKITKRDQFEL